MDKDQLLKRYPWLKIHTAVEEYVDPEYYNRILRDYIFDGKSDLALFEEALSALSDKQGLHILELGCGTGRATKVLLRELPDTFAQLALLDLSPRMLAYSRKIFSAHSKISYIESDSVAYLHSADQAYDLIFSLWSFSHSVTRS